MVPCVSGVIFTYLHTLVVLIITRERDSRMLWTEGGRERGKGSDTGHFINTLSES